MADISKIRDLKNERTYNIADAQARSDLNIKISKNGDTMIGSLNIKNNDLDNTDQSRTTITERFLIFKDKNNKDIGFIGTTMNSSAILITSLASRRWNGNTNIDNYLRLTINKDFTKEVFVSDPAAWRTAIGAAASDHNHNNQYYIKSEIDTKLNTKLDTAGGTITGQLKLKGYDLRMETTGENSDDSGDIAWYYGNSSEKMRIWAPDLPTIKQGPNFRIYSKNGANLFTGTLSLSDHNHDDRYLKLSGDNIMNGTITIKDPRVDVKQNTASSYLEKLLILGYDVNNVNYGYVSVIYTADGTSRIALVSRNYQNNTTAVNNVLILNVNKNGTCSINVSDQQAWRTGIDAAAANHTHNYLPLSGGTMTGQLLTSFKNSVALGVRGSDAHTIQTLIEELRYSSGCMGSVYLTTEYTSGSITLPVGWYNYLYIPHRTGGLNGSANGDNTNYGTLLLFGMTIDTNPIIIRFSSGSIGSVKKISIS